MRATAKCSRYLREQARCLWTASMKGLKQACATIARKVIHTALLMTATPTLYSLLLLQSRSNFIFGLYFPIILCCILNPYAKTKTGVITVNRTAEILGEKWDLPLGFTMALGENPDAMFVFSSMPKKHRESCIDRARNANSRSEMQRIVSDIAQKSFNDFIG